MKWDIEIELTMERETCKLECLLKLNLIDLSFIYGLQASMTQADLG